MSRTPGDPRLPGDGGYQGAKPGASTLVETGAYAGPGRVDPAAMSALLARNWWAILIRGICAIIFGIIAVLMPGVTLGALVLLFAAYMVVDGVFDIIAAVRAAARNERWGALIVEGIIDLIAAAIAFFWPLATIFAFVILMAAWAIISGVALAAAALRLHLSHGRWPMLFAGIVSVIWGILLLIWPIVGAVVVTIWMGAYALFFGGALIVLGLQLRRRRPQRPGAPTMSPGSEP
jgi:uncharacterized membrane protein HdeD (DUF308 family)